MRTEDFFAFARERYQIYLRRQAGLPAPWTEDEILQSYRFCNVFREDDVVTKWFKTDVREPLRSSASVIFATIAFRFFNTVRTGRVMNGWGLLTDWNPSRAREKLSDLKPLITGAYMVKTPVGVAPKLEGIIQILDPIWEDRFRLRSYIAYGSLEDAWNRLQEYKWVGGFMAYEIVTDLRHTEFLECAPDILSWANPGPGATRGIERVTGLRGLTPEQKLTAMRSLRVSSEEPTLWPSEWPSWEMREVEHVLCEFDKYERARLGEGRPKQKFDGKGETIDRQD